MNEPPNPNLQPNPNYVPSEERPVFIQWDGQNECWHVFELPVPTYLHNPKAPRYEVRNGEWVRVSRL